MRWTLIWLCLCILPLWADDRSEIQKVVQAGGPRMTALKATSDWAVATWTMGEAGGQDLLRRYDGHWHKVTGGGGALDAAYLWEFGVPESVIPRLLGSMEGMQEGLKKAKADGPYWAWLTEQRDISADDLSGKGAWELILMRNEIFASHGRTFQDPLLAEYFQSRPWYHANSGYADSMLNERERKNAGFILDYQKRKHLQD